MQVLKINKSLQSLDLSANSLKDEFAAMALTLLKDNTNVINLNIKGNLISLGRINYLCNTLARNRNLIKRNKIPNYKQEIMRLNEFLSASKSVDKNIIEVTNESKEVQTAIDSKLKMLKQIKENQGNKSAHVVAQKEAVNKILKKTIRDLDLFNTEFDKINENNENEIKKIKEKTKFAIIRINKLNEESNNV